MQEAENSTPQATENDERMLLHMELLAGQAEARRQKKRDDQELREAGRAVDVDGTTGRYQREKLKSWQPGGDFYGALSTGDRVTAWPKNTDHADILDVGHGDLIPGDGWRKLSPEEASDPNIVTLQDAVRTERAIQPRLAAQSVRDEFAKQIDETETEIRRLTEVRKKLTVSLDIADEELARADAAWKEYLGPRSDDWASKALTVAKHVKAPLRPDPPPAPLPPHIAKDYMACLREINVLKQAFLDKWPRSAGLSGQDERERADDQTKLTRKIAAVKEKHGLTGQISA